MGIVAKQSLWNSLNAYLGVALGALNTMVFFPYVFLDNPGFTGEITFILALATVVSSFGHLGLPITLTTYLPRLQEKQQGQLWSLALILVAGVAILMSAGAGMARWAFDFAPTNLFHGLIITLGMLAFEVFAAMSQHYQAVVFPQFLKQVFRKLIITVALAAVYFGDIDQGQFYDILSGGYLVQLLLVVLYSRPHWPRWQGTFDAIDRKQLLLYGGMVMLAQGSILLVSRIDVIMIRSLLGKPEVAFYNIALFIGMVVSVPTKALLVSLRPFLSRAWAKDDRQEVENIYRRSALNQLIATALIFLLIWANLDLAWLIVPEEYQFTDAAWVVLAIAAGEMVRGATGVNGMILTISDRQRFNFYSGAALLVITVISNWVLIPQLGMLGAAVASFLAMSFFNLLKTYILGKQLAVWPGSKELYQVLGATGLSFGILLIVQSMAWPLLWELPVASLSVLLIFGALYRYSRVFEDLKGILKK